MFQQTKLIQFPFWIGERTVKLEIVHHLFRVSHNVRKFDGRKFFHTTLPHKLLHYSEHEREHCFPQLVRMHAEESHQSM